jgi:hypothetical protein
MANDGYKLLFSICWADDLHQLSLYRTIEVVNIFTFFISILLKQKKDGCLPALCSIYFINHGLHLKRFLFLPSLPLASLHLHQKNIYRCQFIDIINAYTRCSPASFQDYVYFGIAFGSTDMKNAFLKRTSGEINNELGRTIKGADF